MRWALVTGCSSGLGRSIALGLMREGVSVFAGVLNQAEADNLVSDTRHHTDASHPPRFVPLILDVTSDAQIQAAIGQVTQEVGNDGLWAVVNNAGIAVAGPIEHLSSSQWHRQFAVNFFGVADVTRATLPLLRRGVVAHGFGVPRVMIVSSITGRIAQPMIGAYSSSKSAVTAMGLSLRMELHPHGIGVTILEPGAIATAIWQTDEQRSAEFTDDHPAMPNYRAGLEGLQTLCRRLAASAMPADRAAQVALRSLRKKRAPARAIIGGDARLLTLLQSTLPRSWFEAMLMREYGVRKRAARPPGPPNRSAIIHHQERTEAPSESPRA
jgi:NAD(P)-dependent dehydrogenase (short-subunit alcohol dehydrogenase family)